MREIDEKTFVGRYTAECGRCRKFFHKTALRPVRLNSGGSFQVVYYCKRCLEKYRLEVRDRSIKALGLSDPKYLGLYDVYQRTRESVQRGRVTGHAISFQFVLTLFQAQAGCCALTKLEMDLDALGTKDLFQPSLDRIDSDKGYLPENVHWVCWGVNRMKGDMDQDVFIALCHRIAETAPINSVDLMGAFDVKSL